VVTEGSYKDSAGLVVLILLDYWGKHVIGEGGRPPTASSPPSVNAWWDADRRRPSCGSMLSADARRPFTRLCEIRRAYLADILKIRRYKRGYERPPRCRKRQEARKEDGRLWSSVETKSPATSPLGERLTPKLSGVCERGAVKIQTARASPKTGRKKVRMGPTTPVWKVDSTPAVVAARLCPGSKRRGGLQWKSRKGEGEARGREECCHGREISLIDA